MASGEDTPARAGDSRDVGSIPGWGRSPGEGHGNPAQYPCLENPLDRGAWGATVHGAAKSQIQLSKKQYPSLNGHGFKQAPRDAWRPALHGVAESWTRLSGYTTTSNLK